jgi:hypothetical protein
MMLVDALTCSFVKVRGPYIEESVLQRDTPGNQFDLIVWAPRRTAIQRNLEKPMLRL